VMKIFFGRSSGDGENRDEFAVTQQQEAKQPPRPGAMPTAGGNPTYRNETRAATPNMMPAPTNRDDCSMTDLLRGAGFFFPPSPPPSGGEGGWLQTPPLTPQTPLPRSGGEGEQEGRLLACPAFTSLSGGRGPQSLFRTGFFRWRNHFRSSRPLAVIFLRRRFRKVMAP